MSPALLPWALLADEGSDFFRLLIFAIAFASWIGGALKRKRDVAASTPRPAPPPRPTLQAPLDSSDPDEATGEPEFSLPETEWEGYLEPPDAPDAPVHAPAGPSSQDVFEDERLSSGTYRPLVESDDLAPILGEDELERVGAEAPGPLITQPLTDAGRLQPSVRTRARRGPSRTTLLRRALAPGEVQRSVLLAEILAPPLSQRRDASRGGPPLALP